MQISCQWQEKENVNGVETVMDVKHLNVELVNIVKIPVWKKPALRESVLTFKEHN